MSRIQRWTNPLLYTSPTLPEYRQHQADMDAMLGEPTMETYRRMVEPLSLEQCHCPACGEVVEDLGTHRDFQCCEE